MQWILNYSSSFHLVDLKIQISLPMLYAIGLNSFNDKSYLDMTEEPTEQRPGIQR